MTKYRKKYAGPIESKGLILYYIDKNNVNIDDEEAQFEMFSKKIFHESLIQHNESPEHGDRNIHVLLEQRRDTFEYFDFMQGLWDTYEQVVALFTLMCPEEREKSVLYSFDEQWDDLIVNKNSRCYKENYAKAKSKYEQIRSSIPTILETTTTKTTEAPWGFPKGRKNGFRESDYECALRETEEETHIPRNEIYGPLGSSTYFEEYIGSDGIRYSTTYFLAEVKTKIIPEYIDTPHCLRKFSVSEEVQNVIWVTYEESLKYLDYRRQVILKDAISAINKNELMTNIQSKDAKNTENSIPFPAAKIRKERPRNISPDISTNTNFAFTNKNISNFPLSNKNSLTSPERGRLNFLQNTKSLENDSFGIITASDINFLRTNDKLCSLSFPRKETCPFLWKSNKRMPPNIEFIPQFTILKNPDRVNSENDHKTK